MEGAVKHEYPGEYVASARYKLWHAACYPPAVNKEWNRLRKKFLKSGWK